MKTQLLSKVRGMGARILHVVTRKRELHEKMLQQRVLGIIQSFRERRAKNPGRSPKRRPGDEGSRPPDCGKPAPLRPSPTHHLVAMKSLPPSDHTWLLDAD